MTTTEKLKRSGGWDFCVRRVAGARWATNGRILIRLDGETAKEDDSKTAKEIAGLLERYAAELPSALPLYWGPLGTSELGLIRQILVGASWEPHYIDERYAAMFSGDPRWISGDFRGTGHTLVGVAGGAIVCIIKGMRDDEIGKTWKPITSDYDPKAEGEYYRDLALYPERKG